MTLFDELRTKRDIILQTAAKYGVDNIRVFGSVARGEETENSDIDLLVSYTPETTLFKHAGFISDLEALFHRKIDAVNDKNLHWVIRDDVLKEALPL